MKPADHMSVRDFLGGREMGRRVEKIAE